MNELDQYRLAHEELIALYFEAENDEGTELSSRKIADAATEKALRGVVAWLLRMDNMSAFGDVLARRLRAMLAEEQPRG